MGQLVTGVRAHATSFVRKPLNLVLVLVLPPVVITLYGTAMESFPALLSGGGDLGTIGRLSGALFATAFLTGIIGLFQVISARHGDERLALCGYARYTLLATRFVTVVGVAILAASVSMVVLSTTIAVGAPFVAFGALVLAGVSYGLIGMCVGALIPRELEGSLVLVFLVDIDDAISSGFFPTTTALPKFFPLYHPHALFETAVLDGTVATDHAIGAGVYLLVLAALAFGVYSRVTGERGGFA